MSWTHLLMKVCYDVAVCCWAIVPTVLKPLWSFDMSRTAHLVTWVMLPRIFQNHRTSYPKRWLFWFCMTPYHNFHPVFFREFVKICYTALQINSRLITPDQHEYQEVLQQNFQKLCNSLSSLFGESLRPDDEVGCFKRNSQALFSVISGASANCSSA